jgi:acyl carrier protein
MNRTEIFNEVQNIFRDIFDEDDMVISNNTNSDDIEDWDSLNHINLVSAVEKELKIKFTLNELLGLKNVGAMVDLMTKKINNK